jgi:hypothetical protein
MVSTHAEDCCRGSSSAATQMHSQKTMAYAMCHSTNHAQPQKQTAVLHCDLEMPSMYYISVAAGLRILSYQETLSRRQYDY